MAEIDIAQVTKVYSDGTTAVNGVDLAIEDGRFVVLVGPSGCGKTTLLRMIAGLEHISSGTISIGGTVVNDVVPSKRDIAMVFQSYALYPHMTVYENMAFGLRRRHVPKDEIDAEVRRAAEVLALTDQLHKKPRALSGGQRQRVAMGRAIVRKPWAFLMDEPLSNLDAKLRGHMRAEIARLQRDLGVTTVYVTHDQTEAMTLGDVVAVMNHGVIQQLAPPEVLFDQPCNLFVAAFMGSPTMNLIEATLERAGGELTAAFGAHRLRIPDAVLAARPALADYVGKTIALGFRPEDVAEADGETPAGNVLSVLVELRETLGRSAHLHFLVDARPVVTDDTREAGAAPEEVDGAVPVSRLIANVNADGAAREQEVAQLAVDTTRLQFFDLESGESIGGRQPAATTATTAQTVAAGA